MEYRVLGRTGLRVSQVGFGCGDVGGLMIRGEAADRVRAVATAQSMGINYFDTAPRYGNGVSETNLGLALKEVPKDTQTEIYVGTKASLDPGEKRDVKAGVIASVERSLKRLGRNSVDLIQLHNRVAPSPDSSDSDLSPEDVLGPVVEAFQELQSQGKIRFYGMTGLGDTAALHQVIDAGLMDTVQICYNLLNSTAGDSAFAGRYAQDYRNLIGRASDQGAGIIAIRVVAAGALTGVDARHPVAIPTVAPIGTGRDYQEDLRRAAWFQFLVDEGIVENLVEAAYRFALSNEKVSVALMGLSSMEQLEESVRWVSKGPLPGPALERLPEIWQRFAQE